MDLSTGALILAGGLNSRMGGMQKAMLTLDGETFLSRLETALQPFEEKLISISSDTPPMPTTFRAVKDARPKLGPLGGLAAALTFSHSQALMVCACDMPFITEKFALFLAQAATCDPDAPALAVRDRHGRLHPLCGVYKKSALPCICQALAHGEHRVGKVFLEMGGIEILLGSTPFPDKLVANINTPEEARLLK